MIINEDTEKQNFDWLDEVPRQDEPIDKLVSDCAEIESHFSLGDLEGYKEYVSI